VKRQQVDVHQRPMSSQIITIFAGLSLLFVCFCVIFGQLILSCHNQLQEVSVDTGKYRHLGVNVSSSTTLLPCDEECLRFGRLLDAWPVDKPKAAVVLLVKAPNSTVSRSLRQLGANFNDAYNYPVIVFHEENMNNEADRQRMRSFSSSSLFFQVRITRTLSYLVS